MSQHSDNDRERDERFVERLARHYRPAGVDAAGRTRFDARLHERIERSRGAPAMPSAIPALGGLLAALIVGWSLWPTTAPPDVSSPDRATPGIAGTTGIASTAGAGLAATAPVTRSTATVTDWETDVLLAGSDDGLIVEDAYLPDDYVVLAAFIDGP